MGAALGTLETSHPAPSGQPDLSKHHAFEFGRVDTDGRFSVVIEHGYQSPETVIARLYQWIGCTEAKTP
ncbi:hypothetical protein BMR85_018125 [Achromobacter sp. KAs 3-5]|uniref:hypothetical protein n=1 Tax=Achromobacter mucicolens TaxID=1389922 RepID=UPI0009C7D998|nr:hypothetical protein [Achromobacter mucicolens]OXC89532.1 hypothetical protein BMR85_018125 [Achromobacter sp. KAs 3-5]